MRKYIYITILFIVGLVHVGCSKFDDMNRDPYAIYDAPAESFVQSILYNTEYNLISRSYNLITNLMQQAVSTNEGNTSQTIYNYDLPESVSASSWSLYKQKGNAESMLAAALKGDNPAMEGVALILRTWIMQVITDSYGNVPYFKAGLIPEQQSDYEYHVPYDSQKDIYIDMIRLLERANAAFQETGSANFNSINDYTYGGNITKWRQFGNSLYLRVLMRVALKVIEEDGGSLYLGEEYGSIDVVSKIAELYDGFVSGGGSYPLIKTVDDRMKVKFSSTESYLYTPFYTTQSGTWKNQAACETLVEKMVVRSSGKITHLDPRFYYYFTRTKGIPTQLSPAELKTFLENNTVGYFPSGGTYGDLQNGEWYPVLNYSEVLFNFAEAACRGWLPVETKEIEKLYLDACEASMKEWNPTDKVPTSPGTTIAQYRTYLDEQFDYDKALSEILTQKWISTFWCGVESWADYRRTGYPILKTNGKNARNNGILCTRLRYPATEAYLNKDHYEASVNDWLGGDNNMLTEVWWADTEESKNTRRLGRQ